MAGNVLISVVSPVYKAEKIIPELVRRIGDEVSKITDRFEIVLVEDCGPDNSWARIEEEAAKDARVKGVKLSRNFGQHYAITAGLSYAQGDYVVVIDCDLQDNPKYIADLYQKALEGNDIVHTVKQSRKHSFFKNITAIIFNAIFNYLTENDVKSSKNVGAFSILSRKVVNAFLSIQDTHRHYLMVLKTLGFTKGYIDIDHEHRFEGRSSYSFGKLMKHAINGITSQSDKLLRLSISVGFIMFILSFVWALVIIIKYFTTGLLSGYTSTIVVALLGTGLILMSIGITGIYIGKIFEQTKGRPLFIVDKSVNL
jgi:glycosyltransferase involved in cell wall biosynthesis